MGRRNLKAVGLFDGLANAPNPSLISDSFNNYSLHYQNGPPTLIPTNNYLLPINPSSLTTPDTANSKKGGFSLWIKLEYEVGFHSNTAGIISINRNEGGIYMNPFPAVNLNLINDNGVSRLQLQVLSTNSSVIDDYNSTLTLTVGQWYNVTVVFDVVNNQEVISLYQNSTLATVATNQYNTEVYENDNYYIIGMTGSSFITNPDGTLSPIFTPLKYTLINHLIFYAGTAINPFVMYGLSPSQPTPYYPTITDAGFLALYLTRANQTIDSNRLSTYMQAPTISDSIDFRGTNISNIYPSGRTVTQDFIKKRGTNNMVGNQYSRSVERFHTWADTTNGLETRWGMPQTIRAFSQAVTNGMFMRPAYLPFQRGVGLDVPLTAMSGVIDKKLAPLSNVKPLTASYVNDWPNAPSVFGGSGSLYRKVHENTYPTQTIGTITVNNYKAVAPTKGYFTPSFS